LCSLSVSFLVCFSSFSHERFIYPPGIAKRPRHRPIAILNPQANSSASSIGNGDRWKIQDLVDEMKICSKCKMKFLPAFLGCCCELSSLPFGTITLTRSTDVQNTNAKNNGKQQKQNAPRTIAPTLAMPSSPQTTTPSPSLHSSAQQQQQQQSRTSNSNSNNNKHGVGKERERVPTCYDSSSGSSSISSSDPILHYDHSALHYNSNNNSSNNNITSANNTAQQLIGLLSSGTPNIISNSNIPSNYHPSPVLVSTSSVIKQTVPVPSLGDSNSKKRSFLNSPPPCEPVTLPEFEYKFESINDLRLQQQQQLLLQQQQAQELRQLQLQREMEEKQRLESHKQQHQQLLQQQLAQSVQPVSNSTVANTLDFFGFGAEKKEKFPSLSFKNSI
jgi:hypothetical protein